MSMTQQNDVFRVACRLRTATGEDIVNVFHYQYVGLEIQSSSVISGLKDALDAMYDEIQPAIPSDVSFVDMDFANVTTGEVFPPQTWPSQTTGGGTGDTMPEQCCAVVYAGTGLRHVIGRKFLGPFIESNNSDGVWASGLLSVLASFAAQYVLNVVVGPAQECVAGVARYLNGLCNRFTPIENSHVSPGIYTQRRRRRGIGA